MSGRSSQQKGRRGELEIADILRARGYPVEPGAPANHGTTPDVVGLNGYHLEIKRVERLNVPAAMAQSVRDSKHFNDGTPLLVHRRNREEWLCTLRLTDFLTLYDRQKPAETVTRKE